MQENVRILWIKETQSNQSKDVMAIALFLALIGKMVDAQYKLMHQIHIYITSSIDGSNKTTKREMVTKNMGKNIGVL